jgi:hypothetical protein
MGILRGLVCNNENDYFQKERLIHNYLSNFTDYNSEFYAGGRGVPDIINKDGKPVLLEPKREDWANDMKKLPLNFQDLDKSTINTDEDA